MNYHKYILNKPLTLITKKFFALYENPIATFIISFIIFSGIALRIHRWSGTTPNNYYSYLADAFIHGQLNLRLQPSDLLDLSFYHGRIYLYWPPLPAILTIPIVLIFGVNFNDIILTIVIASLNTAIIAQLLRNFNSRGILNLTEVQRGLLVFAFGFGSAQFPLVLFGGVWSISILMGITFVGLTYIFAISSSGWKAFLFSGISIAAAIATRNTLLLAGIWPAFYLIKENWNHSWKKKLTFATLGIVPILLTIIILGLYNYARFGSFFEFGYTYHNMNSYFRADYEQYGAFSLHYIPRNIYYQWIAYPFFTKNPLEFVMGGSILLLSPVFFGIFWALKDRVLRDHVVALAITILMVYIPIVLLFGTGVIQLGPRYLLDFIVPLLILTGIGIKYWPTRYTGILVAISLLQYLGLIIWAW